MCANFQALVAVELDAVFARQSWASGAKLGAGVGRTGGGGEDVGLDPCAEFADEGHEGEHLLLPFPIGFYWIL